MIKKGTEIKSIKVMKHRYQSLWLYCRRDWIFEYKAHALQVETYIKINSLFDKILPEDNHRETCTFLGSQTVEILFRMFDFYEMFDHLAYQFPIELPIYNDNDIRPEDLEALKKEKVRLIKGMSGKGGLPLLEDSVLEPGIALTFEENCLDSVTFPLRADWPTWDKEFLGQGRYNLVNRVHPKIIEKRQKIGSSFLSIPIQVDKLSLMMDKEEKRRKEELGVDLPVSKEEYYEYLKRNRLMRMRREVISNELFFCTFPSSPNSVVEAMSRYNDLDLISPTHVSQVRKCFEFRERYRLGIIMFEVQNCVDMKYEGENMIRMIETEKQKPNSFLRELDLNQEDMLSPPPSPLGSYLVQSKDTQSIPIILDLTWNNPKKEFTIQRFREIHGHLQEVEMGREHLNTDLIYEGNGEKEEEEEDDWIKIIKK
jgi:hypothetical protein